MGATIAHLDKHLTELGWKSSHAEFGRQSWRIPTSTGSAVAEVHVEGNGIVGSFVVYVDHPADDDEGWSEEVVKLELGPNRESTLRAHHSESDIANSLARYATILATEPEPEEE